MTTKLRDEFFWLAEINKASIVINKDEGLLPADIAAKAASATRAVLADAEDPEFKRPTSYIKFEPKLLEKVGPEITIVHAGRSSQDMHATFRAAIIRDNTLKVAASLDGVIRELIAVADRNRDTVIPCYTNGVAAQPNTYAHYLLAFASGFFRDAERLREFYARLNLCPMGSMVLNGTSWPLNRKRMAEYLGFDAPADNAYDASQIAQSDLPVEFANVLGGIALHITTFLQDLMQQYAQSRPWILLQEGGENTYVSSAMPQKRNPGIVNECRAEASALLGDVQGTLFRAHNLQSGMIDTKKQNMNAAMANRAVSMIERFHRVLKALVINPERALEELNSDWTASQEVADCLMRRHGLPFRIGHHVASRMVSVARAEKILPLTFPYDRMQAIYADVIREEYPQASDVLPMSEDEFHSCLNPLEIVRNRRTQGGPQPEEVERMYQEALKKCENLTTWREGAAGQIDGSLQKLDADFNNVGE